ncbi:zinc finger, CCHC-type containing protein [Tanacetum coccineum]
MFSLNIVNDNIASAFMPTFKLNDSILWHAKLGHVHFKMMQDMSKDTLISAFDMDTKNYLCDMHATPSLRNKKYFVTFIDDASRFYVLEPNDSVPINSIIESRDAIFNENRFSSVPGPSLRIPNRTEDIGGSVVPKEVTEKVVQHPEPKLRKSKRNRTPKDFRPEFQLYLIKGTKDEKEAINDEMDSIMGNNTWVLADLLQVDLTKEFLSSKFSMKDMGKADVILEFILLCFALQVSTPIDTNEKLMPNNGQVVSQLEYSRVIGCLIYAMTCTRPDITFVVGKLEHVLEGYQLMQAGAANMNIYSSASDRVFLIAADKEAELLKNLLLENSLWSKPITPISIHCDSVATLTKAYSQMYNRKYRHLCVRHSMIRELITNGVISIELVRFTLRSEESLRAQDSDKPKGNKVFGPFYVIEPNDSDLINSIIKSMDAIFDENRFSSVPRPSLRIPNGTGDIGDSVVPEEVTKEKEAINDEMDSIMGNNTWVLADLPPVAHISTIRRLIVMASIHNVIIHQMDVKTAFLNGDLEEEVYINQPQGFIMHGNETKVDLTKEFLSSKFFMKDMGEDDVILGIRIKHGSNGIAISQSYYIEKVLKKFNYFDCTPVSTHMDTSEKLMPNNGQAVSQVEYSMVIGCLMYAMTCTRPAIAFAVGKLSRYTSNPGTQHWQAIQRVLKYLKKTIDYRLTYTGYPSMLEGYTDASWISNTENNSSTSGWVFLLGGGVISWASKKQTCITSSTMESKFMTLAAAGKEAEWLKNLLLEIPLWVKAIAPISIRCDSVATLAKAYSQMYNRKSRHLGVRHSMIRELTTNGVISIKFVRSQQNLADHLTKGLARDLVIKSAEGMRLKSN